MALCNYILAQANRPSKEHKRELHSMIVAAYHCLATWLSEHRYLLSDKGCLLEVLHTIEYGISGSISSTHKKVPKKDKSQKPISRRVKNAAEVLLLIIFHENSNRHDTIKGRVNEIPVSSRKLSR